MLFRNYPFLYYKTPDNQTQVLTDVMTRLYFKAGVDDDRAVFTLYNIKHNERPEDVSFKFYGSQDFHWVVLLYNEIIDPYFGWYRTEDEVLALTENPHEVAHYLDDDGLINKEGLGTAVTNLDIAIKRNEDKRVIRILRPQYLKTFVDEYERELYNT